MKSLKISSAAVVAVALMLGSASAQEGAKGAAGGAAAGGGAAGGGAAGEKLVPQGGAGGAGEASPGMKPAGGTQAEPGQRMKGENTGVSPEQKPKAPAEPTTQRKETQGQPEKPVNQQAEPAKKNGAETQQGQQKPASQGAKPAGEARPAPKITNVQETKIQQTIRNINVTPVHVNFNIGVGVAVPTTVVLTPLPPAIITIVPEYEGYRFFVVPGSIVIVDPITLEIVAVLPL